MGDRDLLIRGCEIQVPAVLLESFRLMHTRYTSATSATHHYGV